MPKPVLKNATPQKLTSTKDDPTSTKNTTDICHITVLKKAFPVSFDTIGNMPGTYTIYHRSVHITCSIHPQEVPTEHHEQIEKHCKIWSTFKIITPVTKPKELVSSLTYPCKPESTLHIYLRPLQLK